jgi:hypothetical protein
MSAIITDQLRISNALSFLKKVDTLENSYYVFLGLSNPTEYLSTWENNPPFQRDNFNEENKCWDTMFSLKKIAPNDVSPVVRRINWESGRIYDMYRHDIGIDEDKRANQTGATSLYTSDYYVVTSDYRVYICLQNGTSPDSTQGNPSLDEPTFTDLEPRAAGTSGDGYIWKYLYTIRPNEIVKFDSTNFIPVPKNWLSPTNQENKAVRENAASSGQLKIINILERGSNLGAPGLYQNIPILGDGEGATATIVVGSDNKVDRIFVSNGGSNYTFGTVNLQSSQLFLTDPPKFDVIIPPKGGHGANIYRELGATNILIYSRIENDIGDPDFIVGNKISRIGIIENPEAFDSTSVLNKEKASSVYAMKLKDPGASSAVIPANATFTQQIVGVGTAVGRCVSYDVETGVLKYWQDRSLYGYTKSGVSTDAPYGLSQNDFTGSTILVNTNTIEIDTGFSGISTVINNGTVYLGQNFDKGLAKPEVKKYTGNIIYVDNRPSISRSPNQKEDIKVILQF